MADSLPLKYSDILSIIVLSAHSAASIKSRYELQGADGKQIGDAIDVSDFVKDGMLTDVELIENPEGKTGTFLRFQWNTDSERDPVITDLDVTKLIDVYVAGDGVAIDGKTIKAYIDAQDAVTLQAAKDYTDSLDTALTSSESALR